MLKILIVDDEPGFRFSLKEALLLCRPELKIFEATNVIDGLKYCSNDKYDLIFLDYHMPGKDGLALIKELKGSISEVNSKIYVTTGLSDENVFKNCIEAGAFGILKKSDISLDNITKILDQFLTDQKEKLDDYL